MSSFALPPFGLCGPMFAGVTGASEIGRACASRIHRSLGLNQMELLAADVESRSLYMPSPAGVPTCRTLTLEGPSLLCQAVRS